MNITSTFCSGLVSIYINNELMHEMLNEIIICRGLKDGELKEQWAAYSNNSTEAYSKNKMRKYTEREDDNESNGQKNKKFFES